MKIRRISPKYNPTHDPTLSTSSAAPADRCCQSEVSYRVSRLTTCSSRKTGVCAKDSRFISRQLHLLHVLADHSLIARLLDLRAWRTVVRVKGAATTAMETVKGKHMGCQ